MTLNSLVFVHSGPRGNILLESPLAVPLGMLYFYHLKLCGCIMLVWMLLCYIVLCSSLDEHWFHKKEGFYLLNQEISQFKNPVKTWSSLYINKMFSYLNKFGMMFINHFERQFIEWVSEWVLSTAQQCFVFWSHLQAFLKLSEALSGSWPPVENQCIEGSLLF